MMTSPRTTPSADASHRVPFLLRTALMAAAASLLALPAAAFDPPSIDEIRTPPSTAVKRPSGLITQILEAGKGTTPDANDIVVVHVTAYRTDGKVFRDTRKQGKPASMPLDRVFEGWREGMQLMQVGEARRLWIPEHLGPPNRGNRPRSAVIDVELVDVLPVPDPPEFLSEPDPESQRLETGVHTMTLVEGSGSEKAERDGRILTHYILWDESGKTLDSSYIRGRPTAFMLDRTMPAFSEAVLGMVEGEKRRLWIPQYAHQGQWPKAPEGMMIFDVECVQILPHDVLRPEGS